MTQNDYIYRFVIEYNELRDRREKLRKILKKYKDGTLDFKPKCGFRLLLRQYQLMSEYLHVLKLRAIYEGIDL